MLKKHIRVRAKTSARFRKYAPKYWEKCLISDESIWTVDGYFNSQNERVRATKKSDVPPREQDKFPAKRMVWLGISARGSTGLVHFKGSVNGTTYREKVLKGKVLNDVLVIFHMCTS